MCKLKKSFNVIFLLMLLIMITAVPLIITDYHNRHLIDNINITTLLSELLDDAQEPFQKYNVWERIQAVNESVMINKNDITKKQTENVIALMEEQLYILQELQVLPKLDFIEKNQTSVFKKTYINAQNPNITVSVWGISAEYQDFYLNVYMDTETSLLYDITILSNTKDFMYDFNVVSENGFLEYLQNDLENEKENKKFHTKGYYNENAISLSIFSYDENTQNIIDYYFRNDKYTSVENVELFDNVTDNYFRDNKHVETVEFFDYDNKFMRIP